MITHAGKRTLTLENRPYLLSHAAAVGKKEGEGPLGSRFDFVTRNDRMGQKSWELAESELQRTAIDLALRKGSLRHCDLDLILAGDLLNQCIGSFLASMHSDVPYLGQYGACSTMAQGLALGGVLVEAGAAARLAVSASSHFCSAERQYRFPLAYGGQRTPTSQWTATAAGAVVLAKNGDGPYITHVTPGRIQDKGIKDANNMGAAMAWAAYDTISQHFQDTNRSSSFYDLIVTGDLGKLGMEIVIDLFAADGIELRGNYSDCGVMLFDLEGQDVHCGASGCGCAASVLTGYLLNGMRAGKWRNLLFCATGALHSPTSLGQGESIPGICHAVAISTGK